MKTSVPEKWKTNKVSPPRTDMRELSDMWQGRWSQEEEVYRFPRDIAESPGRQVATVHKTGYQRERRATGNSRDLQRVSLSVHHVCRALPKAGSRIEG